MEGVYNPRHSPASPPLRRPEKIFGIVSKKELTFPADGGKIQIVLNSPTEMREWWNWQTR